MNLIKKWAMFLTISALTSVSWADNLPQSPDASFVGLSHYSQQLIDWHLQLSPGYDQVIPTKNTHIQETLRYKYYGDLSAWEPHTAYELIDKKDQLVSEEKVILKNGQPYYKRPIDQSRPQVAYTNEEIAQLEAEMNLKQFQNYQYDENRRAIILHNANLRILPTKSGFYKNSALPGQGPDFEYNQVTGAWIGMPVYILGESLDKNWVLLYTTDCIAWTEKANVAPVSQKFIDAWKGQVNSQGLVGIIKPATMIDLTEGHIGTSLPLVQETEDSLMVMIPKQGEEGDVTIKTVTLSTAEAVKIPFALTPKNFVTIIQNELGYDGYAWGGGRPYGMSEDLFYNDVSSEMKNLFVAFGIYLPRHSTEQVEQANVPGKAVDYSYTIVDGKKNLTTVAQRIEFLKQQQSHAFMTIINGTALYLGNYTMDLTQPSVPLLFHNIYGLKPSAQSIAAKMDIDRRAIIGKASILPMLVSYPEDVNLTSFVERSTDFKLMFLDDAVDSEPAAPGTLAPMNAMVKWDSDNKLNIHNLIHF